MLILSAIKLGQFSNNLSLAAEEIYEKLKAKTKSHRIYLLFTLICKNIQQNTLRVPALSFAVLSTLKTLLTYLTYKSSNSTICLKNMHSFCADLQSSVLEDI